MSESDILNKLKQVVEHGGRVVIQVPKQISNIVNYLNLKKESYESLFNTCITNNDYISNQININKFLNEYSDNYILLDNYMRTNLKELLGEDNYKFVCESELNFRYDTSLDLLYLFKVGVNNG